ncbi:asparaginase [Francisella adeliensis]|uniref:Asparaginase n=1 Tax=Francisella adeliensis TaxID=2007306 RepID=A0A2Z4Y058_9GAMM|nr:asparaginase [Francisella adeliensis]AXA34430.1 hypothetical protein CDH04_08490 [Francisella adeliensis]MBK2086524.1 asparaginase [Francisella adeliensis]MBK2096152.1 asparaginase [Francisella adeliensis]QIW12677.1 asparaginase [Francisella adeliensis]QIW14553.1 asparaginase [Francisella adeliensis]
MNMIKSLLMIVVLTIGLATAFANKPEVIVLGTGGTISAVSDSGSNTSSIYTAGKVSVLDLIKPITSKFTGVKFKAEQVFNKDSGNITYKDIRDLALVVKKYNDDKNIRAIVITHGTDTMQETAYFLFLTIQPKKPIVIVGSMRSSDQLSSDGAMNLYDAISVGLSGHKHVMVVMNDNIYSAKYVQKMNTTNVDAFKQGRLGTVTDGKVEFFTYHPEKYYKIPGESVPKVVIASTWEGMPSDSLDYLLEDKGLKGLVVAGLGDGNIPSDVWSVISKLTKKGVVVIRSSRVPSGENTYNYNNLDDKLGTIPSYFMTPDKARIKLELELNNQNTSSSKAKK